MYKPEQFEIRLPWEIYKNPTPPMKWLRKQLETGKRLATSQEAFMAEPQEIREAMALSCGMITMIDDAVGVILAKLKQIGRYDNTVVVFNSDHGDYLGDFGLMLKGALPFCSITKVPFIWSDPTSRKNNVSNALASTIDIASTIMARAGVRGYNGIQGRSLLDSIDGSPNFRTQLLTEHQDGFARMGATRFMMVRNQLRTIGGSRFTAVKTGANYMI